VEQFGRALNAAAIANQHRAQPHTPNIFAYGFWLTARKWRKTKRLLL
jgi:hypothetical protein